MNIEIKFRAKTLSTNDWVFGDLHLLTKYPHIHDGEVSKSLIHTETIGQFTGLCDKNGNEIYKGDILRVKEYKNEAIPIFKYDDIQQLNMDDVRGAKTKEWIGEVKFEESVFFINDTYLSAFHGDMRLSFPIYEIEVIGNIYDNSDLLEK